MLVWCVKNTQGQHFCLCMESALRLVTSLRQVDPTTIIYCDYVVAPV